MEIGRNIRPRVILGYFCGRRITFTYKSPKKWYVANEPPWGTADRLEDQETRMRGLREQLQVARVFLYGSVKHQRNGPTTFAMWGIQTH
jgi:hypothetical protein